MRCVHQPRRTDSYADNSFAETDVRRDEEPSHRSLRSVYIDVSGSTPVRSRYSYHDLVASIEEVNRVPAPIMIGQNECYEEITQSNVPRVEARLDEALMLLENS